MAFEQEIVLCRKNCDDYYVLRFSPYSVYSVYRCAIKCSINVRKLADRLVIDHLLHLYASTNFYLLSCINVTAVGANAFLVFRTTLLPFEILDSWHSSVFWLLWLSYISYIYITISKLPHQLTTIYFYFNRTKASTRQYALSPSRLYFSDLMGKQIAFIC